MAKKKISSSIKSGLDKANPFNKPIDKNDVSDTGSESTKLGYKTGKTAYRTGKTTAKAGKTAYKTTKKTAKAAKSVTKKTVKTAKNTAKSTVKATKITVKATVKTASTAIKVATEVVVQIGAALSNPYVLAGVLIVIVIAFSSIMITSLIGGGGGIATTITNKAYGSAAGLDKKMPEILAEGKVCFDNAAEKKKNEFYAFIDGLYYSSDDLPNSDLVYMICNDGAEFTKRFAELERKNELKNKFSNSLSETEAIALVYVYLEKKANEDNDTEGEIYKVDFTDDAFDELLDMMIAWSDTIHYNQECPKKDCSVHIEEKPNPYYQEISELVNTSANAYNDWGGICVLLDKWNSIKDGNGQKQYWNNTVEPAINTWLSKYRYFEKNHVPVWYYEYYSNGYGYLNVLGGLYEQYCAEQDTTPETIITKTATCDRLHNYHAIGLDIVSADAIMTAWNFSDIDRKWYDITYKGLQNTSEAENST